MADQKQQIDPPAAASATPPQRQDMTACVAAMGAALLPWLPGGELQASPPQPSHQIDVESQARDFAEAAKKLQLYLTDMQDQLTNAEKLQKETVEEELKVRTELVREREALIQGWRKALKDQLDNYNTESA